MSLSTNGDSCVSLPGLPGSATWVLEGKVAAGRAWPCVAEHPAGAAGPGSQTCSGGCACLGRTRAECGPAEGPREAVRPTGGGREPLIRAAADTEASLSLID